jgi:hypothetical protein
VLQEFCQVLEVLGSLGRVVVRLRKPLTFWMPFPITLSILDSADLNQNLTCLPSMKRGSRSTPTSAWRL